MIETFWRRHRAAILLGLLGLVLLGTILAFSVLLIASTSHCTQCDVAPPLMRGFGFAFLIALLFGLATALVAAALRRVLVPAVSAGATTTLLVLLTVGAVAMVAQPAVFAVQHLEYRLEKAKDDARMAELRELCPDRPRHLAIIHDALPRPLPRDTFVAEVSFPGTNVTPLYQGGERARVKRVVQGDPAIREFLVERVLSDRCDKAFENGREGLVVVIPKDLPRGNQQKVEPIFVRRGDGFRLPDGFQIQQWQRPYWLVPPKPPVPGESRHGRSVTHAENGIATTSVDSGPAIVVRTAPPTNLSEAREAPRR